jgi:glycosyltransferase involved in cell wall biosynthesis
MSGSRDRESSTMRVAIVTPGFSADEDDWCIPALLNLVRRLARDHDVHVFALRYPYRCDNYAISGATVHAFGGATARGRSRVELLWSALRALVSAHRRQPFDVFHAFWADEPGFLAVTAGALCQRPSLVSMMGGELVELPSLGYGGQLNRANRWLTATALRRATFVTSGSFYQDRTTRAFVSPQKLTVLPLGIDLEMFSPDPSASAPLVDLDGEPALLSVGSLVPVKDQATLLGAFGKAREHLPQAHLHLVGDGPLRSVLEEHTRLLSIGETVTFHGGVRHERLPGYYRVADLFVLTSRHESQGLAPLEAAGCGCPVVGTAVGVIPELSESGTASRPGDAASIAREISALSRDRNSRDQRANHGLTLVRERFALDRTASRLVALYRALRVGSGVLDQQEDYDATAQQRGQ